MIVNAVNTFSNNSVSFAKRQRQQEHKGPKNPNRLMGGPKGALTAAAIAAAAAAPGGLAPVATNSAVSGGTAIVCQMSAAEMAALQSQAVNIGQVALSSPYVTRAIEAAAAAGAAAALAGCGGGGGEVSPPVVSPVQTSIKNIIDTLGIVTTSASGIHTSSYSPVIGDIVRLSIPDDFLETTRIYELNEAESTASVLKFNSIARNDITGFQMIDGEVNVTTLSDNSIKVTDPADGTYNIITTDSAASLVRIKSYSAAGKLTSSSTVKGVGKDKVEVTSSNGTTAEIELNIETK